MLDLEQAYLAAPDRLGQSGFAGSAERWERLRRPILEAVDSPGVFLDIGCANGHLMHCLWQWSLQDGVEVQMFGVDVSAALVELARQQHPQWRDRYWVADARSWAPPRRFDFVRAELVYAPGTEREFVEHLINAYLRPTGRLILTSYASRTRPDEDRLINVAAALEDWGFAVTGRATGTDTDGVPLTEVAWVDRP